MTSEAPMLNLLIFVGYCARLNDCVPISIKK